MAKKAACAALVLALSAAPAASVSARKNQTKSAVAVHEAAPIPSALLGQESLSSIPMHMYREDCGKSKPVSKALLQIPGAGIDQSFKPFDQVLKDGYYQVDCIKDYLFEHGDKYGNNKFNYQVTSDVSIVLYNEVVPKGDRKPMSHSVCFAFCRTVPNMGFFGIQNGRNCYCAPWYKAMASDSSRCDIPCEGNPSQMCGGQTKSTVFSMHSCDKSDARLVEAAAKLASISQSFSALGGTVTTLSASLQTAATELQQALGVAGDPTASALMQTAKVFAGELEHAAGDAAKQATHLAELQTQAAAQLEKKDTSFAGITKLEELTAEAEQALAAAEETSEHLQELLAKAAPAEKSGAGAQYYPVMHFVDKTFEKDPSTCGGKALGKPLIGTYDACAGACDGEVHDCVGFSFFADTTLEEGHGVCFLFSELHTATYWTKCAAAQGQGQFLQKSQAPIAAETKCVAKFNKFEASGIKQTTKADRCF